MVHEVLSGLLGLFDVGSFACVHKHDGLSQTPFTTTIFEDQRNADMGKYFGKDITLFTWNT